MLRQARSGRNRILLYGAAADAQTGGKQIPAFACGTLYGGGSSQGNATVTGAYMPRCLIGVFLSLLVSFNEVGLMLIPGFQAAAKAMASSKA